ncbi:unnamed protein product [Pleuronectes platessa]|uniref:Uncharacterized protein n=1 Tax=Pleuronectes platessa TaxID=8262 RepID=A0A9N7VMB6_PLEPL|nr:unnamed protein product [Pleuronectes platessa]
MMGCCWRILSDTERQERGGEGRRGEGDSVLQPQPLMSIPAANYCSSSFGSIQGKLPSTPPPPSCSPILPFLILVL